MEWTLYAARGILGKNSSGEFIFDPTQIEEGLKLDLMPQVIINSAATNPNVIEDFSQYLKLNPEIEVTAHGHGEFANNFKNVEKSIEAVIKINEKVGRIVIPEIVFHGGSVYDLNSIDSWPDDDKLNAKFGIKEYLDKIELARLGLKEYVAWGLEHGIDVLLENVGQVNFGFTSEKTLEERKDPRWGTTPWRAEKAQFGDVGCVYDLERLTDGLLCIDTEHLHQSAEYSNSYNLDVFEKKLDEAEKFISNKYGIFIREGEPILFNKKFNPFNFIRTLNDKVRVAHLGGQVMQTYSDNGITKIGSHMPITFPGQDNEYYDDEKVLQQHNLLRKTLTNNYLQALHDVGCRKAVLELHLGPVYVGPKWQRYNKVSADNVKSILSSLK